jgi:glycosyltransferase involved in cell wall biosynthesis
MNVVMVDGDVAYPPSNGKRLRTLNLMLRLARRHRVTYIARCNGGSDELRRADAFLREHGIKPVLVDHPVPPKKGPAFYARLAANVFSPLPYSVASFDSPLLRRAVQEHEERHSVDLWQFEWTPFLSMLRRPARARRVLMAPNVDSLIWQRYYETERSPLKRWYIHGQWRKFERYERRTFAEADCVVTVSETDAALARGRFGVERVEVVDNGVDGAYFGSVEGLHQPDRVLFLGALDWRPNLDAIQILLDAIFPAVRAQVPTARLSIVGRSPPEWLRRRVTSVDFADLYADVADVRPYLGDCGVMAVPLRIGGGSRLKILEALASGLPVVSTRVGAEGLHLENGRDLTVVERTEDMARALVDCIRAPEEARRMAEQGRRMVRERYDWDVLADKLEAVWESVVRRPQSVVYGA